MSMNEHQTLYIGKTLDTSGHFAQSVCARTTAHWKPV